MPELASLRVDAVHLEAGIFAPVSLVVPAKGEVTGEELDLAHWPGNRPAYMLPPRPLGGVTIEWVSKDMVQELPVDYEFSQRMAAALNLGLPPRSGLDCHTFATSLTYGKEAKASTIISVLKRFTPRPLEADPKQGDMLSLFREGKPEPIHSVVAVGSDRVIGVNGTSGGLFGSSLEGAAEGYEQPMGNWRFMEPKPHSSRLKSIAGRIIGMAGSS